MGVSLNRLTRGRQATQLRTDRQLGNGQGSAFRFRAAASVMTAGMLCSLAISPGCQAPSQVIGFQHQANRDIVMLSKRSWGGERLTGFVQPGVGPTSVISAEGWKTTFFWKNKSVAVECRWGKALIEVIDGLGIVYGRVVVASTKMPGILQSVPNFFALPTRSCEQNRALQKPITINRELVEQFATESAGNACEISVVHQITAQGIGDHFTVEAILPIEGDHVGSITIAQEGATLGFLFQHTGDSIVVRRDGCDEGHILPSICWGSGSIVRFKGDVPLAGFRFTGDKNDPLSFVLLKDVGFVHLCGRGTVTDLASGKVVRLTEDDSTGVTTGNLGMLNTYLDSKDMPAVDLCRSR